MSVDDFLSRTEARHAENTLKNRRVALRQFREYLNGLGLDVQSVEPYHIEDWIDTLLLDDYAPRSIRAKVYIVSAYYEYAANRNEVDENPVESVNLKGYSDTRINESTEVRYITPDDYQQMLSECGKLRNELLLRLLWNTGVRASEAVDIQIEDIDRDDHSIVVETAKSAKLKSAKKRTVYYNRQFAGLLRKWLDKGGRSAYLGVEDDEQGYLLVTKQAPSMAVGRVSEIVREIAEPAGVQEVVYTDQSGRPRNKVTAHTFRHSYAVNRVKKGMPLVYLQTLMGHSDIDITRKYLHFREDDVKEADKRYRP